MWVQLHILICSSTLNNYFHLWKLPPFYVLQAWQGLNAVVVLNYCSYHIKGVVLGMPTLVALPKFSDWCTRKLTNMKFIIVDADNFYHLFALWPLSDIVKANIAYRSPCSYGKLHIREIKRSLTLKIEYIPPSTNREASHCQKCLNTKERKA